MQHTDIDPETNRVTGEVVDSFHEVHRQLWAGLLESMYQEALAHELRLRGFFVRQEVPVPVEYKVRVLPLGFRLDLVVNDCVLIEVKAVESLHDVAFAQIDTYLKLTGLPVGFLVNFHVAVLKGNYHRRIPAAPQPLRASASPWSPR